MPARPRVITAGLVLVATLSAATAAAASTAAHRPTVTAGPAHRLTLTAHLKVLGQQPPTCHGSVCTIRTRGAGTMTHFGKVTFVAVITDDTATPPCPNGSWVPRLLRNIHTSRGDLVLHEAGLVCPEPKVGPRVDLVWVADGARSTGVFAGVSGSGSDHVYLAREIDVPTGTLTLAR